MADETENAACQRCWKNKRRCPKRSPNDRCKMCNHRIVRGENGALSSVECSESFPDKDIDTQFRSCGWDQTSALINSCSGDVSILDLDIRSATPSPDPSPSRLDVSVKFYGRLAYHTLDVASLNFLEGAIVQEFSSNLKSKAGDSAWISCAILAGALLHVLCSAHQIRGQIRTCKNANPTFPGYTERNLSLDFRRALAYGVGKYIGIVMNAVRSTSLAGHYDSLCAYAAAALLYPEVDYFARSLKHGELSTNVPPGLDGPFLKWLTSIGTELENRVAEGCGTFSAWPSLVDGSRKLSRRHHDPLTIFMHLRQYKSDSPSSDSPVSSSQSDIPAACSAIGPQTLPPYSDTGPGSQLDLPYFSGSPFNTSDRSFSSPTNSSLQGVSPLVCDYAPDPQASDQYLDPSFYDPVIGDMLDDHMSGFIVSNKEAPDIGDMSTQSFMESMNPSLADEMTSSTQAVDRGIVSGDRHPYSNYSECSKLSRPSAFASEV